MMTKKELAEKIKTAVEQMKNSDGCYEIHLVDKLSVFVGWLNGYDADDATCIHSISEPTWCLNVGIKVNTSDAMKTDYEYLNAPFYDSGDVWNTDVSVDPDEDYEALAEYLLKEAEAMQLCAIEDDGRIANYTSQQDFIKDLLKSDVFLKAMLSATEKIFTI